MMSCETSPAVHNLLPTGSLQERGVPHARMTYLWMRPPRWDGHTVVVAVHGISRNHHQHAERFLPKALAAGAALIVPRFSNLGYRGYQRLRKGRTKLRADQALAAVLEDASSLLGHSADTKIRLFGFSGGAQFAHRFSLVHPERVQRQALVAAGFYTFPRLTSTYPYGLARTKSTPRLDPRGYLLPTTVFVGDQDIERDDDLRKTEQLDQSQGLNRLERARRYVLAVRSFAASHGRPPSCLLSVLDHCDHSFTNCAERGGLVRKAMKSLLADRHHQSAQEL